MGFSCSEKEEIQPILCQLSPAFEIPCQAPAEEGFELPRHIIVKPQKSLIWNVVDQMACPRAQIERIFNQTSATLGMRCRVCACCLCGVKPFPRRDLRKDSCRPTDVAILSFFSDLAYFYFSFRAEFCFKNNEILRVLRGDPLHLSKFPSFSNK